MCSLNQAHRLRVGFRAWMKIWINKGPIFLERFGMVGINSAKAQCMCTPNPSEVQINSEFFFLRKNQFLQWVEMAFSVKSNNNNLNFPESSNLHCFFFPNYFTVYLFIRHLQFTRSLEASKTHQFFGLMDRKKIIIIKEEERTSYFVRQNIYHYI